MRPRFFIAVLLGGMQAVLSQGTFVNLDFENPMSLSGGPGTSLVWITNALPHWTGYIGNAQVNYVAFNSIALDAATISLHSTRSITPAFDGNYSVLLQASSRFAPVQAAAAIGQTGLIPQDARSLLLYTKPFSIPFLAIQVTFAGETISMTPIGAATATYQAWGGDISRYAGQAGELRFTVNPTSGSWLDNIQFSSNPVPEPGAWALFGLGSALLCCAARRRCK
jgi:hypothetical protein